MKINRVKHAQNAQTCGKCGDVITPSRDAKQRVLNKRSGKTEWKTVRVLGDSYQWIKFNRGPKLVRCMKAACGFRQSDMTRGKMSGVYAAQEAAQDTIAEWDGEDIEDLKTALTDAAEAIREVASEYGESADNMEQAFPGGSPTIDECREKQEELESWADELENTDLTEWDGADDDDDGATRACVACDLNVVKNDSGGWSHVTGTGEDAEDGDHTPEPEDTKNSADQTHEEWVDEQRTAAEEAIGNCPV